MRIIDAGTEPLSNTDVLDFLKAKRTQIKEEDAQDKADGKKIKPRPQNFLKAIDKHQRVLESPQYPYVKNPKAYTEYAGMQKFDDLVVKRVILPCSDKYRGKKMTAEEIEATLGKEHEMKQLTDTEHLQIYNHAPQCVEMLQPMIENYEERFTTEEMDLIQQAIIECYRAEETEGHAGGDDDAGAIVGAEDADAGADAGAGETGVDVGGVEEGIREMSPYSARAAATGPVVGPVGPESAPATLSLPIREHWALVAQQTGANTVPVGESADSEE
ncbi:hypothetical protein LTR85_011466 [Meristemomyces frigidus]|nr:hypothetical protein LTR85_011466 [Meristemomyces frigidus]